jgi:acyl-CoA synthetase (AMP-forming)/AMP-acid ligase II
LKKGWLCTGDAALISIEGFLKIKGRNDDLIIKAGMNIYPAEIESTLKCDPRVKEVLAFSYENRFGTQIGLKIAGDFPSVSEIRELCNKLLPPFQRPSKIELVKELLKNGSGKIIRRILQ